MPTIATGNLCELVALVDSTSVPRSMLRIALVPRWLLQSRRETYNREGKQF